MGSTDNKLYYLVINGEGKFNYSNKGFQATPHYISLVTAKYRVKDIINSTARFFNPRHAFHITRVDDLRYMKVRAYQLNSEYEMIQSQDQHPQPIREFALAHGMGDVVKNYDALMIKASITTPTVINI